MAITLTDQLGLKKPDRYTDEIWTPWSDNSEMLNRALAGYLAIAQGDAAYTIRDIDGARESRTLALKFTTTLTAARVITIDTTTADKYRNRVFIIWNASSGNFKLTIKTSAGGSTGVDINSGYCRAVWHDGTHVYAFSPEITPTTGVTAAPPHARVFHSTTQSLANANLTALNFNSERWDNNSIHDTSTNNSRLTLNRVGLWAVFANVGFAFHATGSRSIQIQMNGNIADRYGAGLVAAASAGSVETIISVYTEIRAAAVTDYVELLAFQDSGGSLNTAVISKFSPDFGARWISA